MATTTDSQTAPDRETADTNGHAQLDVAVRGMTCASCAARLEKRLSSIDGVDEARVNYATELALVRFDTTLVSPQLVAETVADLGYKAELPSTEDSVADAESAAERERENALARLRHRLILCAVLSAPVVAVSMIPPLQFRYWQWFALQLATPVVLWGGWPFHRTAFLNLRHRTVTMDTLISLGTLAAWLWSLAALFLFEAGMTGMRMHFDFTPARGSGISEIYLEVAVVLTTFVLAGRYFESRARGRAGAALEELLKLGAKDVGVLDDDGLVRRVPIEDLKAGDRFVVRPGEKIATDGEVEEGASAVDQSLITGESVPVDVGVGDSVVGASINTSGRLVVRAVRVGSDTALAQIARLVADAQSSKAPIQRLADRIALVFVPAVIALSTITFFYSLTQGSLAFAFTAAVAVLIIACPCALGLATPTALLVGTGRGAQLGLLIKGPEVLESTRRIDTIVLDKTGTVTTGKMHLVDVYVYPGTSREDALRLSGALEKASEHPIGQAIADAAETEVGRLPAVRSFSNHAGLGVEGTVGGHAVVAGRTALLEDRNVTIPDAVRDARLAAEADGKTATIFAWDGQARGVLVIADEPKPSSAEAIRRLRALDLQPVLLTGDNETTARRVAAEVGIDEVIAEVLPQDKAEVVRRLQSEGRVVAMVGDGVNDAPALAQADLGVAIGTGSDVAIEASELTLISGDLCSAADAIRLSRRTLRTIKGNLSWAFFYNVAALPLAAMGRLNPLIAGAAMSFSSVFVVSNSLRLRRFKGHAPPEIDAAAAAAARREAHVEAETVTVAPSVDGWNHDANLKVLLDIALGHDEITRAERDEMLSALGAETGRRVIRDSAHREVMLARELAASPGRMFAYEDLMATLESADLLDRVAEELPSTEEMTERRRAGLGMQRAELAILFRGAETHLAHAVEASSVGDEPFLERDLRRYFPPTVVTRYGHLLGELPQRRQLIAAINGHLVVNTLGPTFVSRLMTELGAEPHDVVRAYRIAREVTGAEARRDEIEQLGDSVPADATAELTGALDTLEESVTRWYLLHPRTDMQRTVNAGTEAFEWLVQDVPDVAPESWRERWAETAGALVDKGVPEDLASAQALQPQLLQVPDMVAVSQHTARGIDEVARMLFLCGEHLLIDSLEARLASLPATSRAQAWAIQVARDDARNARSEVAQRALAAAHDAPVDAAFARFQASQSEAIQRLEAFIGALAADGSDDLAGLTLAVRHVRALGGMRRGYAPTKSGPRVRENVV